MGTYLCRSSIEIGMDGNLTIGRFCSIALNTKFVVGMLHDYTRVSTANLLPFAKTNTLSKTISTIKLPIKPSTTKQCIIGNDVWIGNGVSIIGGVKIGNGAVIGASAVVTKDIPPYAIVVGNPARIIRYRFEKDIIEKLNHIKWWHWKLEKIQDSVYDLEGNVESFIENFSDENDNADENQLAAIIVDLQKLQTDGYQVFYFIPDFNDTYPVWENVINAYITKYKKEQKKVCMILGLNDLQKNPQQVQMIQQMISAWEEAPWIATIDISSFTNSSTKFKILKFVDEFITTKDKNTVQYVDYCMNYDTKVICGLNDLENMFE